MRILFFGDVVGEAGREAVRLSLPRLRKEHRPDFVIANGENATHGKGLSEAHHRFLIEAGVDCLTLGNHWHAVSDIDRYVDKVPDLVRPLNLLNYSSGAGSRLFLEKGLPIRVTNVLGTAFMEETVESPYAAMSRLLSSSAPAIHIVDFHADSTSEKAIFAYYLDGKVSAVIGTHTHVQTNDARILPAGTGFLTDVGMCGASDGIIGVERNSAIRRIVYGEDVHFAYDPEAPKMIAFALIDIDEATYKTKAIQAFSEPVEAEG
jgi:metallophosphoesterase (TIGR00282 family)